MMYMYNTYNLYCKIKTIDGIFAFSSKHLYTIKHLQHARPRCAVGACLICVHVVFTDFSCDRECDLQTLYISKIPCSSAYVLNSGGIRSGLLVWSIFQRNGSFFKFLVLTALLCQWIPNPIELFFCSYYIIMSALIHLQFFS